MGIASEFHSYTDTLQLGNRILVVGPGHDLVDINYWKKRGHVSVVQPTTAICKSVSWYQCLIEDFITFCRYDVIWFTHCLEHCRNPGLALDRIRDCLDDNGNLFISVPPYKKNIVGGHISLYNMGLLWYQLILAGFDVRNGSFKREGYNLFAHVQKGEFPKGLCYDNGDIETIAKQGLWPKGFEATQGFNGEIDEYNWQTESNPCNPAS